MTFDALKSQWRVIFALMLRGIKTRFFGSGLGYILAVGWPLSHILIIVGMASFKNRIAPYGESIALFAATGVVPFQIFSYISRFMMMSILNAKPLLYFPDVKLLDLIFAGIILEILSTFIVVLSLLIIGIAFGVDIWPKDEIQCFYALSAAIVLGVGFGMINSAIALIYPFWTTISILVKIILWISSGIFFVADNLPENIRYFLSFIPTLQLVEWVRYSYYDGYGIDILDKTYTISFSFSLIFFGLFIERIVRGQLR